MVQWLCQCKRSAGERVETFRVCIPWWRRQRIVCRGPKAKYDKQKGEIMSG
jgi:hypothetical protein